MFRRMVMSLARKEKRKDKEESNVYIQLLNEQNCIYIQLDWFSHFLSSEVAAQVAEIESHRSDMHNNRS